MQDPNGLMFDTEQYSSLSEKIDQLTNESEGNTSNMIVSEEVASHLGFDKDNFQEDQSVPKISLSVKDDIANQKIHAKNKIKADIFNTLFNNELQLYYDEHKHVMPSKEKKRLKSILIKKIDKGDIYINKVGKLIIRKGKNK